MITRGCPCSTEPWWHNAGILSCSGSSFQDSYCASQSNLPTSGKITPKLHFFFRSRDWFWLEYTHKNVSHTWDRIHAGSLCYLMRDFASLDFPLAQLWIKQHVLGVIPHRYWQNLCFASLVRSSVELAQQTQPLFGLASLDSVWCRLTDLLALPLLMLTSQLWQTEDDREMCARTIYCTNIDKKVNWNMNQVWFMLLML
jgi:hypothetical protein